MTKILRVADVIHQQLKKEAVQEGRTLQWWVEYKLTSEGLGTKTLESSGPSLKVPPVASAPKESPRNVYAVHRTTIDVLKEKDALQAEIDNANTLNQDPDYWDEINAKKAQIQKLWDEYTTLK